MKKLLSTLLILSLIPLSSTLINNPKTENIVDLGIKEYALDKLSNNNDGISLHDGLEATAIYISDIYAQFGFNENDNNYYLRFVTAVKGDIHSLSYTREVTYQDEVKTITKDVDTIYQGITVGNDVYYYDGDLNQPTHDESKKGDYYWACYTIKYTSSLLDDYDLTITLNVNNDSDLTKERTISLKDVIKQSAYLMEDEYLKYEAENLDNLSSLGTIGTSSSASNGQFLENIKHAAKLTINKEQNEEANYMVRTAVASNTNDNMTDAYYMTVNGEDFSKISVDNRHSWNSRFYPYECGIATLKEGDNSITINHVGNGNVDYISLASSLKIVPNENNSFDIYSLDNLNAELTLNLNNENNSRVQVIIDGENYLNTTNNGQLNLGVINLKRGKTTITVESEKNILKEMYLSNMFSQGTFAGQELTLEAENGLYNASLEYQDNVSSNFTLKSFNKKYVSFTFENDNTQSLYLSFLYSSWSDKVTDYDFNFYVNNHLLTQEKTYSCGTWSNSTVTSFYIDKYLHSGFNTFTIEGVNGDKFNPDALVLQQKRTYNGNENQIYQIERSIKSGGRFTTNLTKLENVNGDSIFSVLSSKEQEANLIINYAHSGDTAIGAMDINVNGELIQSFDALSTGAWTTYIDSEPIKISLKEGENLITLKYNNKGGYNLDYITISPIN